MTGENIIVIGEVANVTQLFTRTSNKSFVKATVEDISGGVEVAVWPGVYDNNTGGLWQVGNLLQLEATVKIRDDSVQLNVNKVCTYQLPVVHSEEVVSNLPDEPGVMIEEDPSDITLNHKRSFVVSIAQTSGVSDDKARLEGLIAILKGFSGKDEVTLRVETADKFVNLKLPSTNYCPELRQRLVELVGEDGVKLELTDGA